MQVLVLIVQNMSNFDDLGDRFGVPTTETPETLLENAIARM